AAPGLPLRHQHRGLPGRGRGDGGRPGTEHLGHVRGAARTDRRRLQRGRRCRSLPPRRRGRRPDEGARRPRLPLLRQLVARPAHRSGARQRQGAGVLRPPGRHAAGQRDRAHGDALPLGPAAGARGRRRVAQPGDGGALRRLRRDRRRPARRPGGALDPGPRAERRLDDGVRRGHPRAGPHPALRRPVGLAPPAPGARPGRDRAPSGGRDVGRLRQQPRPGLAGERRRRRRGREQDLRRPVERDVPRADAARSLPRGPGAAAAGPRAAGRPRDDPPAARLLRRQLLQPGQDRRHRRGGRPALRAARHHRLPHHRRRHARRAGRPARVVDPLPGALPRSPAPDRHHRLRVLLRHRARRAGGGRRPGAHRLPPRARQRRAGGRAAGRRRPRLLRVLVDGRLRLGRGSHAAHRPGARRPRDPGPHAQGVVPLVRAADRGPAPARL
ncbi:MAG: GH1 / GH5_19, partial [uncultured Nocardioidaceae bacterium]